MLKAYKYRLYPNKEQEAQLQKTFGCCRFVYNQVLDYRKYAYDTTKISMNKTSCNNYCNQVLKKEYPWLKEVDKFSLTNAIYNMDNAYQKFFKEHAGYPKFKSKKKSKHSYTTNFTNNNIKVDSSKNTIQLPKLKDVSCKLHREFTGQIKSATISQVFSGNYFVSILVETEHVVLPTNHNNIGLDLGIKDLIITSNGEKYSNPKTIYSYEKKLEKLQRQFSRKKNGGKNKQKHRKKVAKLHEKIANIRKDNLHKLSHQLIYENQVIVSENLKVSNMVKNHHLAKSIHDCSWQELTRQLQYKADWNHRTYVKINTFYPSSQLCHVCGFQQKEVKNLAIREWTCPDCGSIHDRDINASINILNEGLRQIA